MVPPTVIFFHPSVCICVAALKAQNFQACTEPIHLFNIFKFFAIRPSVDGLAVLQQSAAVGLPTETRITYDTLYALAVLIYVCYSANCLGHI